LSIAKVSCPSSATEEEEEDEEALDGAKSLPEKDYRKRKEYQWASLRPRCTSTCSRASSTSRRALSRLKNGRFYFFFTRPEGLPARFWN
jgi:hypothetical protein